MLFSKPKGWVRNANLVVEFPLVITEVIFLDWLVTHCGWIYRPMFGWLI